MITLSRQQKLSFFLSRQALLDYLAESEKELVKKIKKLKPQDPMIQRQLLIAYLDYQKVLAELKRIVQLLDQGQAPTQEDGRVWTKDLVAESIRENVHQFLDFVQSNGFYQEETHHGTV